MSTPEARKELAGILSSKRVSKEISNLIRIHALVTSPSKNELKGHVDVGIAYRKAENSLILTCKHKDCKGAQIGVIKI